MKAIVAVEHAILIAIWTLGHTGAETPTQEPTTTPAETPNGSDCTPCTSCSASATTSPPALLPHQPKERSVQQRESSRQTVRITGGADDISERHSESTGTSAPVLS